MARCWYGALTLPQRPAQERYKSELHRLDPKALS
jgi:hypothetical protein